MAEEEKSEKKIEDSDWKADAEAEKKKLEEELIKQKAASEPLPPASFTLHLVSLANQAVISMGLMENPVTGEATVDLDQSKFIIDTMQILKEKTAGNLEKEEEAMLDQVLYDLRMKYVSISG